MHTSKRLKIYCALLLLISIVASTVASVGTSYAHFVYTGEHQVVLHKEEETKMESNVMFPQGCTVVLDEWNMNSSCEPQAITASFYGKEANGRISCLITQEYSKYYTVAVTDTAGTPITENDEISVTEDGTDVIITVTPVKDTLNTLTTAISAEVLLTFTELEETTLEDGTVIVSDGDKMSGTLKWKVTPLDEPLPEHPPIPTATVTEIENEDLTFALNFKADTVTALQLDYYGSWYADFELKVNKDVIFNADGTADGWLSGQYDAWSENWVNVPFEDVTLSANTPLKIMEYAAELMGQSGLKYTYAEVYEGVKEFNCGVFFSSEFLIANPDLEVTLELRMYNPEDETESYVIGETYSFTYEPPAIPTASATVITNDELTFAMNFKAAEVTEEQLAYYNSWYTDYEITLNKPVTFHANNVADGWLSGQLDAWSANWVKMPLTAVSLSVGQSFKIMQYASEILNKPNYRYTYGEVYEGIKDFDCGVFFNESYLVANPDLEVTLELRMYNPANETEYYVIGDTYKFYASDLNVSTEEEQPAETVACEICGLTDHTTENCLSASGTSGDDESGDSGEETVTEETVSENENTENINTEAQAAAMMSMETESLTVTPMLFTFTPVLTTVNDILTGSEVQTKAVNSTEIYPLTANMSNVCVAYNTDVITYTYITYSAGTKSIVITDIENVVVDEGTRHISNFTPYTQVHTEEMIYVLPYGKSFTIETDPAAEGTVSLKIVSKGAYVQEEETDVTETETNVTETDIAVTDVTETDATEETETSAEEEEVVFTSKAVKWYYESGTTVLQTSENICYEIDGSEFDNNAPLTEILSATGPVVFKTMPETDGKTVYSVEYYSNGAYTPAAAEDFSIEIDKTTSNLILNTGEHYPQAGIYRVCLQLQKNNNLSAYYKTFFVNYR